MWTYEQSSGRMLDKFSRLLAVGYSGKFECKNDCRSDNVPNRGPIPIGKYDLGTPIDTVTHGPYVMALHPHPSNQMHWRSGFLIHGDSVVNPGTASEGCIILPRFAREQIWKSGDHSLEVISGPDCS